MRFIFILFLFSFAYQGASAHDNGLNYNVVSLQESISVEVDNDQMTASVVVQHDDKSAKEVARLINVDMQWALKKVRAHKEIKAQTLSYSTYPRYKDNKVRSWSGSQRLSLESQDFDLLTKVIAELQDRLQVNNINFSVSAEKYKAEEDALVTQAIQAFKNKAKIVSKAMGESGYKVVNMNVNTNRHYARPVQKKYRSSGVEMMMADGAANVQPGVAAGTNTVKVNISGQIQAK